MGDYFRGWRRKIGLATLLLACIMTAGWVRSGTMIDFVVVRFVGWVFVSGSQQFRIIVPDGQALSVLVKLERKANSGESVYVIENHSISSDSFETSPLWHRALKGYVLHIYNNKTKRNYHRSPYWVVVQSLMLISAWLLLFKGPTTQKHNRCQTDS